MTIIWNLLVGDMLLEVTCQGAKTKVMNILSTNLPGGIVGKNPDWRIGEGGYVLIVRSFYLIWLLQKELLARPALCIVKCLSNGQC